MDALFLIGWLIPASGFGLAGVGKFAEFAGTPEVMRGLVVVARAFAHAIVSLSLARPRVHAPLTPPPFWGVMVGLGAFWASGAGFHFNHGRGPLRYRFDQDYSASLGPATLSRNDFIASLPVVVVALGPEGQGATLVAWSGHLSTTQWVLLGGELLLLASVCVLVWLLVHLLHQQSRLLLRLEALETAPSSATPSIVPNIGLPIGMPAPSFELAAVDGGRMTLDELRAMGRPTVIIFADPDCAPCQELLPEVARVQENYADVVTIAVVSRGSMEESATMAREHRLSHVIVQQGDEVANTYASHAAPSAVLVRRDGTIGSQGAVGLGAVRMLIARVVAAGLEAPAGISSPNGAHPIPAPAPSRIGEPAPDIVLPNLAGETVSLADFRGEPVLVLFWSPDCGFCQQMLGDLLVWETSPPPGAPRLLVVSRGEIDANRNVGLQSPVLLDQSRAIGRSFGTRGTPAAVLVDDEGRIASDVAAGVTAVLALLRGEPVGTLSR